MSADPSLQPKPSSQCDRQKIDEFECNVCGEETRLPGGTECETCGQRVCVSCYQVDDEDEVGFRCNHCLLEKGFRSDNEEAVTRCGVCDDFRTLIVDRLDENSRCMDCGVDIGRGSFIRQCPGCYNWLNNRCFACQEPGCRDPDSNTRPNSFSACKGCKTVIVACCLHRSRLPVCVGCGAKHLCSQCVLGCFYCATSIACRGCIKTPNAVCRVCIDRISSSLIPLFSSRDLVRMMMDTLLS